MFPALIRIPIPDWFPAFLTPEGGSFPIRMFGVMVILGFLAGTWLITRRLRAVGIIREGAGAGLTAEPGHLTKEEVFDFCFYLLAVGILGSRLLFVFQDWQEHPEAWRGGLFKIFKIWEGGLVWYGGFALSAVFAFLWLALKKLPVLKMTDAAALGVALALAIGRWGCFCAGDDYGLPILAPVVAEDGTPALDLEGKPKMEPVTDAAKAPWYAIRVPTREDLDWRYAYTEFPRSWGGRYVHPVQLYMSLKNLVVLGALLVIAKKTRRTGMITASYLLLYPVGRFIIEFWRGDEDRGVDVMGTGLSFSQFFGIFVFLAGLFVLKQVRTLPQEPPAAAA